MRFKKNFPLKNFTSFKIGGPANFFGKVKSASDFEKAVNFSREKNLPFFILGGGSNVLVSDKGFFGVVVKNEIEFLNVLKKNNLWHLKAGSGLLLSRLINYSLKNSLSGVEYLFGIPGTLGGAIFGNAGAFGHSISEVVKKVEVFDLTKGEIRELDKRKIKFGYRNSIFKEKKDLVILSAYLELKKSNFKSLKEIVSKISKQRKEKQPLEYPTAGSIFKNVPVGKINSQIFEKEKFLVINKMVPAGYLIEKLGLKGLKKGKAMISEKHANFIINLGGARARDVKFLIDLIKDKAWERFKIKMEEEICYLGHF